jgi:lipopolysaccharide export system protein LptC
MASLSAPLLPLVAVPAAKAVEVPPARPRGDRGEQAATAPRPPRPPRQPPAGRRAIGVLRIAFPLVGMAVLVLVVAWPTLWPEMERLRLRAAVPVVPLGEGSDALIDTTLSGIDGKGRPYVVRADVVHNVNGDDEPMLLTAPYGELAVGAGKRITLSGRDGTYDAQNQRVDLRGEVTLVHPAGYEVHTTLAQIDLPTGEASGDAPVRAEGPLGTITAEGFRITDEGSTVNFTGRSRMTINPERSPIR